MTMKSRVCKLALFLALMMTLLGLCAAAAGEEIHTSDHVWGDPVFSKAATCSSPAVYTQTCTICGQSKSFTSGSVDPNAHQWGAWYTETAAECEKNGLRKRVCTLCGTEQTEAIPSFGHDWGEYTTTKEPTCTAAGTATATCKNDVHHTKTKELPALGHKWGEWTQTKAPTCLQPGEETRTCSVCNEKETRPVPATGHDWGEWTVTTKPTCLTPGKETRVCKNDASHKEEREVPATGHDWGDWTTDKEPTCTAPGTRSRVCKNDPNHKETETLPATGHNWNPWTETPATCKDPGERTRICKNDPSHKETETIPPLNHPKSHWVITKQPTYTEEGERKLICDLCGEVLKVEKMAILRMSNNTICAFGPRLRDTNQYITPYTTDVWYMYTPFDASVDGKQTFELVASNMYIVGELTLEVRDGNITVNYKLVNRDIDIDLEFFTILNQIQDIHMYEPEELLPLNMPVNRPINMAENFGDDTNLVLYFCSRCNYQVSKSFKALNYESVAHQRIVNQMIQMMDK